MSFLKAEWRKLAFANYVIDKEILQKYVPVGTEIDTWEGKCYVSLVGFMFVNTRVLGLKIPFHVNFEEVNLRFYVKRKEGNSYKRGVVFIKEIVPKPAITFVANTLYKEKYETMPMRHLWAEKDENRQIEYHWKHKTKWNSFKLKTALESVEISEGSETEFITEHYWGYAKASESFSNEYEVTHPKWKCYPIQEYQIDVDFGALYGNEFSILNDLEPTSVMLAEGSEITVENKRRISF
ncbi:YqjF family protein [Sediminitomix flava]|uniref:DUF2071 domain-containing protein n=1 Tax=Sediminitomix flava TaxID=379075 RepID=A0A315ZG48_SEDFL|nr:DUF2071 domain-containing protein [Sediminitomix flava]PWJ44565.1 hypothetical protein BC781_101936 [Sediminitomix flava]